MRPCVELTSTLPASIRACGCPRQCHLLSSVQNTFCWLLTEGQHSLEPAGSCKFLLTRPHALPLLQGINLWNKRMLQQGHGLPMPAKQCSVEAATQHAPLLASPFPWRLLPLLHFLLPAGLYFLQFQAMPGFLPSFPAPCCRGLTSAPCACCRACTGAPTPGAWITSRQIPPRSRSCTTTLAPGSRGEAGWPRHWSRLRCGGSGSFCLVLWRSRT